MTHIKTLAEILADMGEPMSADSYQSSKKSPGTPKMATAATPGPSKPPSTHPSTEPLKTTTAKKAKSSPTPRPSKTTKNAKPTHQTNTPSSSSISTLLSDDASSRLNKQILDEKTVHALKNVAIEPIYQNDEAINRLRWLAFYYLSNRELSQKQLRQKLLDKECDPQMIEELLVEFAQKDYQSDKRYAFMLIREGIRRGRGKHHIAQSLKDAGVNLPYSLDELIQMADVPSLSDGTVLAGDDNAQQESINWLKLAVEARCKKYGNDLPTDQKQKARQLRFLQYRGFEMSVCFDALKYTLDDMDELDFV